MTWASAAAIQILKEHAEQYYSAKGNERQRVRAVIRNQLQEESERSGINLPQSLDMVKSYIN